MFSSSSILGIRCDQKSVHMLFILIELSNYLFRCTNSIIRSQQRANMYESHTDHLRFAACSFG